MSRREFADSARQLSAALPSHQYAINLCSDRGQFMLALVAGCLRGQTQLLPGNQSPGALEALGLLYPSHHVLDDAKVDALLAHAPVPNGTLPLECSGDHVAVIAFTSGSTGQPQPNPCSWAMLRAAAERSAAGIFGRGDTTLHVVGTIPPQHMFGLETTILQPLVGACAVDVSRPFFPADVAQALDLTPAPRALVTTPVHLRTLAAARIAPKALKFVLSATAPLSAELARQIEIEWRTQVLEIYGSTETGAIATRRTTSGDIWTLLPGGELTLENDSARFRPRTDLPVTSLQDRLERVDDSHFVLAGRNADLIKVAGKRASLGELNARLLAIPGVLDGTVIQPVADGRVAALVVSDRSEAEILAALARDVDEVFLPRPLRRIAALPRDALGKLPRDKVLAALGIARGTDEARR